MHSDGGRQLPDRGLPSRASAATEVTAAIRRELLAVRTIAVTMRAARRERAAAVPAHGAVVDLTAERWRRWALGAIQRHAEVVRSLPRGTGQEAVREAFDRELAHALASLRDGAGG